MVNKTSYYVANNRVEKLFQVTCYETAKQFYFLVNLNQSDTLRWIHTNIFRMSGIKLRIGLNNWKGVPFFRLSWDGQKWQKRKSSEKRLAKTAETGHKACLIWWLVICSSLIYPDFLYTRNNSKKILVEYFFPHPTALL